MDLVDERDDDTDQTADATYPFASQCHIPLPVPPLLFSLPHPVAHTLQLLFFQRCQLPFPHQLVLSLADSLIACLASHVLHLRANVRMILGAHQPAYKQWICFCKPPYDIDWYSAWHEFGPTRLQKCIRAYFDSATNILQKLGVWRQCCIFKACIGHGRTSCRLRLRVLHPTSQLLVMGHSSSRETILSVHFCVNREPHNVGSYTGIERGH